MAAQREWFEKDYYRVLGVPESASHKEIQTAYRKLSRKYHPDANQGDSDAEDRFKEVSAAYDVIGSEETRKEYDEVRRLGPMGMPGGPGGPAGAGGPDAANFRFEDMGDLGDVLGGLFGRTRRGGGSAPGSPGPRGTGPHRGRDLEAELHLDFDDAVKGITTTLFLTSEAVCTTCHGSGAKPGTTPAECPYCEGRGVVDENQGFFSFSTPCPHCGGRGVTIADPCPSCAGSGIEHRPREVKAKIPPGVEDGQRIRLRGRGAPGRHGGPAGDLYVTCRINPHKLFGRKGRDLTLAVPLTFPELALGAEVKVPTLDGKSVTLKVPAGTRSGRTFRVKGRGVETKKGTGDLLVTVEVAVPQKLSAAERKAMETLAASMSDGSPRAHLGV
jgi:molecular chaperone DnaJ